MTVIGLCGGSGSGKGTVAKMLCAHGPISIDADLVYRELTSPGSSLLDSLVSEFGESILSEAGGLDRKALAAIVFAPGNQSKLNRLNEITHRAIIEETESRIDKYSELGYDTVIFDAPLLFESGFSKKCDMIIAVISDINIRIRRISERDNISEEMARSRIANQLSDDFLISNSDYQIINNGSIDELSMQVDRLAEKILNK